MVWPGLHEVQYFIQWCFRTTAMAGISNRKLIPSCIEHGKPCFIKTGTRDGPSKGKSFFICGNQENQCSFVEPASGISNTTCSQHGIMNDLRALCKKNDGLRCYYRCTEGKRMNLGWCGFENLQMSCKFGQSLADVTNMMRSQIDGRQTNKEKLVKNSALQFHQVSTEQGSQVTGSENKENSTVHSSDIKLDSNRYEEDTTFNLTSSEKSALGSNQRLQNPSKDVFKTGNNETEKFNKGIEATHSSIGSTSVTKPFCQNDNVMAGTDLSQTNPGTIGLNATKDMPHVALNSTKQATIVIDLSDSDVDEDYDDGSYGDSAVANENENTDHRPPVSTAKVTQGDDQKYGGLSNSNGTNAISTNIDKIIKLANEERALENELEAKKTIMKKINLHSLPDQGRRMLSRICEIEAKLNEMKLQKRAAEETVSVGLDLEEKSATACATEDNSCDDDGSFARNSDIGLNLQLHLPPGLVPYTNLNHFNRQPLYGGRMTHSKLQQVGRVTKDAIETLHRSLETCPTASTECPDPDGLYVTLMPHQRHGLAWLLWREKQRPSGGILADDMGLGKTLTSIALIMKDRQLGIEKKSAIQADMKSSQGTLVVCPASLVHHWKKEIEKRVKPLKLTVCLYHGQTREKSSERLSRYDVVLTTYSIVAIEAKGLVETEANKKKTNNAWLNTKDRPDEKERKTRKDSPVCQIHWRRIILDEAHNIKNPKCMTSVAACYLEAESRWALTGTPIQNNTKDLYAIIKFLRCSPFDELKVWSRWVDDRSKRGTERMNTLVKSLLLRRTKDQKDTLGRPLTASRLVLLVGKIQSMLDLKHATMTTEGRAIVTVALPSRNSIVHNVSLTGNEREVYDLLQHYSKNMLTAFMEDKGKKEAGKATYGERCSKESENNANKTVMGKSIDELLDMFGLLHRQVNAGAILLMVLRLRQCCSHLSLLQEVLEEADCKEEGIEIPFEEQMMNMSIVESDLSKDNWNPIEFKQSYVSTKINALLRELQKLQFGSPAGQPIKSVIVSQWTKMLDIIALHLRKNGFKHDFITGSVSLKKRSEIVESFNTEPFGVQVMLVSLRAGGVGLNLIGGSHLFLLDQHWNPALEDQACDRIYRVGQKNDVVIHRFLCTDTIEQKIAALQDKKKSLADSVLKGGKQKGNKLTLEDLRTLFGV